MDDILIDEICNFIKDNLKLLLNYDSHSLINLRKYYQKNLDNKTLRMNYDELLFFTEEALADLINTPELYDFRKDLE